MNDSLAFRSALVLICGVLSAAPIPAGAQDYDIDCKVILCLAGGFPAGCGDAFSYMMKRILSVPPKPPFGFCAFGSAASGPYSNDDPRAHRAMMQALDDEGMRDLLASIHVDIFENPRMCSAAGGRDGADTEKRCVNYTGMNGDGTDLTIGALIEGWFKGKRVTFTDLNGAARAYGDAKEYLLVSETCRTYGENDARICEQAHEWTPIARPYSELDGFGE